MKYKCQYNQKYVDNGSRKVVATEVRHGMMIGISTSYEEFENGVGNFPVAIILTDDGKLVAPYIEDVFDISEV